MAIFTAVFLCFMLTIWWFSRAPHTPRPAPAQPLDSGAVVFYSPAYRVGFFGLERLHPADTFRADRIAAHLVSCGLLSKRCFGIPQAATHDQLVRVHAASYLKNLQDVHTLRRALEVPIPTFLGTRLLHRRVLLPFLHSTGGTLAAARAEQAARGPLYTLLQPPIRGC